MLTNVIGETRHFPWDKPRVPGRKRKTLALPHNKISRLILKLPAFSLSALSPEGSMLAASLTCLSQPQFLIVSGCGRWVLLNCSRFYYSVHCMCAHMLYKGWAASLFSHCCHTILVDHRLMQLSNSALHCVEWNFRKWKVWFMFLINIRGISET